MQLTASGRRFAAAISIFGAAFSQAAMAQNDSDRIRELERKLERSQQQIELLMQRVNELEKGSGKSAPAPAPATPAAQEARIQSLETSMAQISSAPATSPDLGIPLHAFADVGYEHSTQQRTDGRRGGFVIGNLDLYLTPSIGDRIKTVAELVFEVTDEGGLATDLERLQLGYTVSDALTVWMGRFHTPYGYWNAAFHHGAQIQTAVTRPRFIDFEDKGGILPSHAVGIWANGSTRAGSGKIHYDAYVANGNQIVDGVLDFNAHRDDNNDKMLGGNLGYQFGRGALEGLTLGVHGMRQEVASRDAAGAAVAQTRLGLSGAYLYYEANEWEAIGEYYRFRNKDLSGGTGTHASWAGFMQIGRTFADLWTPFYRWEKASLDTTDNYFATMDSGRPYSRHTFGLRYNLNAKAALKFEANRTRDLVDDRSYSEARAQFAIRY